MNMTCTLFTTNDNCVKNSEATQVSIKFISLIKRSISIKNQTCLEFIKHLKITLLIQID